MNDQLKTLSSLAILKVDLDEKHRDYFDYLLNFVVHSLTTHKPEVVTDREVSDFLKSDFGLNIL